MRLPAQRAPIIDVHLHAVGAADQGPPPAFACPGTGTLPAPRRADSTGLAELMACARPLRSATDDESIRRRTVALMARYNVRGVLSGERDKVEAWMRAAPGRFIAGAVESAPLDSMRRWAAAGTLGVIGELGFQYAGLAPTDSVPLAYFALADSLDLPIAVHVGPGPPGAPYFAAPAYRMALSDPLALEAVLVRHPRLRVDVMHAGWPMGERMLALMWAHPQVYVDIGVLSWAVPQAEFYRYLRLLMDAGMGTRILFGSDQMVWPEALEVAIRRVERAPFLTHAQKRDILYHNTVRFLRLETEQRPGATFRGDMRRPR